jgi:selenocysteine lyase/cysteine desulfurase
LLATQRKTLHPYSSKFSPSRCSNVNSPTRTGGIEYFQWIGREFGDGQLDGDYQSRRLALKKWMTAIHTYELELSRALLSALESVPGLRLYGLTDPKRLEDRVATFSFRLKDIPPRVVAEKLAQEGIYVWDGNYYALNVTERLGVEESGGMVRVGAVHYNTLEEVERLKNALLEITAG